MTLRDDRIRRSTFSTRDQDEAVEFVRQVYVDHQPCFAADRRSAELAVTSAATAELAADVFRVSMNFAISAQPFGYLMVLSQTSGRVRATTGAEEIRVSTGDSYLLRPDTSMLIDWHDPCAGALRLPLHRVAAVAAESTGIGLGDLRFEAMRPIDESMNRYWRRVSGFIGRELLAPASALAHPLVADQMLHYAAETVLAVFPNTTMAVDHRPDPRAVAPASVRRAAAFIDTNADRVVDLAGIAADAGVSPRALQYAFRRHYGTTPSAYLRRVRLHRAHLELQGADPSRGDTVSAIARHWGFAKPARFAAAYRAAYGRPPSHTLRT